MHLLTLEQFMGFNTPTEKPTHTVDDEVLTRETESSIIVSIVK